LNEAFAVTRDPRHRTAALRCVTLLHETATRAPSGAAWKASHDILTGAAGTGLFLHYAAEHMGHEPSKALWRRPAGRCRRAHPVLPGRTDDPGRDAEFTNYFYGAVGYGLLLLGASRRAPASRGSSACPTIREH